MNLLFQGTPHRYRLISKTPVRNVCKWYLFIPYTRMFLQPGELHFFWWGLNLKHSLQKQVLYIQTTMLQIMTMTINKKTRIHQYTYSVCQLIEMPLMQLYPSSLFYYTVVHFIPSSYLFKSKNMRDIISFVKK